MGTLELMACIILRPLLREIDQRGFLRFQNFQVKDVIRNHVFSYLLELNDQNGTFDLGALHSRILNEMKWVLHNRQIDEHILYAKLHQGLIDLNQVSSYTQRDLEGVISRRRGIKFRYIPKSPEFTEQIMFRQHGF